MQVRPGPAVYGIDAGGSRTTVTLTQPGVPTQTWSRETFAIASAGEAAAQLRLESVLRELRSRVGPDSPALGCIASSSMPVHDEAPGPRPLIAVIAAHAPAGRVVIVNDVVPPLWAAPLDGVGIIMCSGTGSCVIGRDTGHRMVKVGGHEHILSDQGSAYSLAREGLRAAARDVDGTGPATKLRACAETFFGVPLPALGRQLAELPRARPTVASFAPCVTGAAEGADEVAAAIVATEAAALARAAQVAAAKLGLRATPPIGFTGGVLHGSTFFRSLVERELVSHRLARADRANLHLVDATVAGISFAERLGTFEAADDNNRLIPDGLVMDVAR
jgi:N-acetylglucosamine kinase-like BadF-type ATPase